MSWAWPSMSARVAVVSRRVARPASTVPSSSRISLASANRASPTRMAWAGPCTFQTVSRWRRCSSPSIRSSCSSEKLCTSSTATAPGMPTSGAAPAASADSTASAGRTALPPSPSAGLPCGVDPAEVVGGDGVHGRREPVDGRPQYRGGQGPAALQQRGHVHASSSGRRPGAQWAQSLLLLRYWGCGGLPPCRCIERQPPPPVEEVVARAGPGRSARRPPHSRRCGPHSPWSRATRWRSTLRPGRGRGPWCGRRAAAARRRGRGRTSRCAPG